MFKYEQTVLTSDFVTSENWKAQTTKSEKKLPKVNQSVFIIPKRQNMFSVNLSGQNYTLVNQCGLNSILSGLMNSEVCHQTLSQLHEKPAIFSTALKLLNQSSKEEANHEVLDFVLKNVVYAEMDKDTIDSLMTTASILRKILPASIELICNFCSKRKKMQ